MKQFRLLLTLIVVNLTICQAQDTPMSAKLEPKGRITVPIDNPSDQFLVVIEGMRSDAEGLEIPYSETIVATYEHPTIQHHVSDVQNIRYFVKVDPNCSGGCYVEEVESPIAYQTLINNSEQLSYSLSVGDQIKLDFNDAVEGQITILSIEGKKLLTDKVNGTSFSVNNNFSRGIYLISFESSTSSWNEKIIIN